MAGGTVRLRQMQAPQSQLPEHVTVSTKAPFCARFTPVQRVGLCWTHDGALPASPSLAFCSKLHAVRHA